jgi:hypothetical protein
MKTLTRNELALMLVWAFRDQRVESAINPPADALTLYCNVIALPVAEAATIMLLARWTCGLAMLRDMLDQPMCNLSIATPRETTRIGIAA